MSDLPPDVAIDADDSEDTARRRRFVIIALLIVAPCVACISPWIWPILLVGFAIPAVRFTTRRIIGRGKQALVKDDDYYLGYFSLLAVVPVIGVCILLAINYTLLNT